MTFVRMISLNKPYSYENLVNDASLLSIAYPDLIQVESIGTTVSNRSILMLKIGKGKRGILLTGGVHGRETINSVVLMRMIEEYACAYTNPFDEENMKRKCKIDIRQFLCEFTLYTVPLMNPDGYTIALNGFHVIHNEAQLKKARSLRIPYQEWKYNQCSIDINRNFPSITWREKFYGDEPGSELETKALMKIMIQLNTEAYIDYHSRGNEIYYYRNLMPESYNERQLQIAKRLSKVTGYKLVPPNEEIEVGDTGGNTVHYYSEQTKMPAFTIETVPDEATFPLSLQYQRTVFCQLLYTPFAAVTL